MKTVVALLYSARPRQWVKNSALFLALIFSGRLFTPLSLVPALGGFIAFCLLSSSQYIVNDILDLRSDRAHPYKKYRPIALGTLTVPVAIVTALLSAFVGLWIGYMVGWGFFVISVVFIIFQYLYALVLKNIPVIDVLTITVAYILRVYAGSIATNIHVPVWLVTTAVMFAMLLAIGKRRAEFIIAEKHKKELPRDVRDRLKLYSDRLLDTYMATFGTAAFLTYIFFTFFSQIDRANYFPILPEADYPDKKWLMITIPFVLFAIMRYMQLVYEQHDEVLEKVITRDRPLVITVILWVTTILVVVYGVGG